RRSLNKAWRRFCRAWASKCEPHNRVASFSRDCDAGAEQARNASSAASFLLGSSMGPSGPDRPKPPKSLSLYFGSGDISSLTVDTSAFTQVSEQILQFLLSAHNN